MKKFFKHTFAIMLAVIMVGGAAPVAGLIDWLSVTAAAETVSGTCGAEGDNVTWTLDTVTGELVISGTGEMDNYNSGEYGAPWIDYRNFIKYITIFNGVTIIGSNAFNGCSNLVDITIPSSVTTIDPFAFTECFALTDITIPEGVTYINYGAFYRCTGLTSVKIPGSVTRIMFEPFLGCTNLTEITVGDGNANYCSDEYGVLYNKDKTTLVQYPIGNPRKEFTIPDSVRTIDMYAFAYCTNLISVNIPENVRDINSYAFAGCTGITNLIIPFFASISYNAFQDVCNISGYFFEDGWGERSRAGFVDGFLVYDSEKKESLRACSSAIEGEVTLPDSVTSIGDGAFKYCKNLTSAHISFNVKSIADDAFLNHNDSFYICCGVEDCYAKTYAEENGIEFSLCNGHGDAGNEVSGTCGENLTWKLNTVTGELIVSGTGEMDDYEWVGPWYDYEDSIRTIVIDEGVTSIGDQAFLGCKNIQAVTIPESLTKSGWNAFAFCDQLKKVYYNGTVEQWCGIDFITVDGNPLSSAHNLYVGNQLLTDAVIPKGITSIKFATFCGCESLTSITIPDSVTSIEMYAFRDCENLTDVYYGGSQEQWENISISGFDNDFLTSATIHFHEHNYTSVVTTDPTCTEKGYTKYTCACGDSYVDDYVNALGHDFSEWVQTKAPTIYEEGEEIRTCSRCKGTETRNVAKLPMPKIDIKNFTANKNVDYKTTITFTAEVKNAVTGAAVHWFIDGKDAGTGDKYTVTKATKSFTVQVKYIKDGKTLAESGVESVNVKTGFFAKLAAFFRSIFGALPKVVQGYLGAEIVEGFLENNINS